MHNESVVSTKLLIKNASDFSRLQVLLKFLFASLYSNIDHSEEDHRCLWLSC